MNNRSLSQCCNDATHKLGLLLALYKERGASPREWEDLEEAIRSCVQPDVERLMELQDEES
jgi:hypothetical protein